MALEVTGGRHFASDFSKFDKFLSFEVFRTGKWIPRSTRIDLAKDDIKLFVANATNFSTAFLPTIRT